MERTEGFLNWVTECNTYVTSQFTDFILDGFKVGGIHQSNLAFLDQYPHVFQKNSNQVTLHSDLTDFESRTQAVEEVLQDWREKGIITGWRDEQYRVSSSFHAPPFMAIERSAASFFGIFQYGVHINGIVKKNQQTYMWIAKRSQEKPRFPGFLDHLVAGGHPIAMEAKEVLVKECYEEANIPETLAQKAQPAGAVTYRMDENSKLKQEILFVYDLILPESFIPENTDGEVEEFYLWPINQVIETIAQTRLIKPNCNLVMIDYLIRQGYITPEEPHYLEIVKGLHTPLF